MKQANNGLALLTLIPSVSYNFESQKYLPLAIFEAKCWYFNMKQGKHETAESLLERFQSQKGVLKQMGAVIGPDMSVVEYIVGEDKIMEAHHHEASECLEAIAFLMASDKACYEGSFHDLENEYLKDQDNYLWTLNQAYSLIVNWKQPISNCTPQTGSQDGIVLTQQGNHAG